MRVGQFALAVRAIAHRAAREPNCESATSSPTIHTTMTSATITVDRELVQFVSRLASGTGGARCAIDRFDRRPRGLPVAFGRLAARASPANETNLKRLREELDREKVSTAISTRRWAARAGTIRSADKNHRAHDRAPGSYGRAAATGSPAGRRERRVGLGQIREKDLSTHSTRCKSRSTSNASNGKRRSPKCGINWNNRWRSPQPKRPQSQSCERVPRGPIAAANPVLGSLWSNSTSCDNSDRSVGKVTRTR